MTSILVIAAHPDDEVLGPGATLARLREEGNDLHVAIVTEGSSTQYPDRPDLIALKKDQARSALEALGGGQLHFGDLPDMKLDTIPLVHVNAFVERVVRLSRAEIVFTHHASDLNRDHRIVHEASVVACRPLNSTVKQLLAYEVLGVTNFGATRSAFRPTLFFEAERFMKNKHAALRAYDIEMRAFPHPRSVEAIEAQGRLYGVLGGMRWAEGFEVLRMIR